MSDDFTDIFSHGFGSPEQFWNFKDYLLREKEWQQISAPKPEIDWGINVEWFRNERTGYIYRLAEPDFPFKGTWERITSS